jgi:flagellar biosynthesis protein FlhB
MTFGGIIAIFIAIWIYRTAIEHKTGNALYWVAGSFILFLVVQFLMINLNGIIIEMFDSDINSEYDSAGGLNARDNADTAGLQSGSGGSLIGITFELLTWIAPFFVVAIVRQLYMLKQSFSFMGLFSGLKEMFVSIKNSFKTS